MRLQNTIEADLIDRIRRRAEQPNDLHTVLRSCCSNRDGNGVLRCQHSRRLLPHSDFNRMFQGLFVERIRDGNEVDQKT